MLMSKLSFFEEQTVNGRRAKIAKIKAKLHDKVILHMSNYHKHIRAHHPEMTLEIIYCVLTKPDEVYRKSRSSKESCYYKHIDDVEYKVIIAPAKYSRKTVVTAYPVSKERFFFERHKEWCSYCYEGDDAFTI
jgi:gamma-glutamyl:cysteine ligase YbdK (ATP-grasp superfamily)